MLTIKQSIMHHLEWNSRFDQCLVKAELRIFHQGSRLFSAIESRSLLRVNHPNSCKGSPIAKISFVCIVPFVDLLYEEEPSTIDYFGIELSKPGTKTLRDSVGHPEPHLFA